MFLRAKSRLKDGQVHRYWSIVENRRTQGNRIVQRRVLYLGEINDNEEAAGCKTIEVLQEGQAQPQAVAIFPEDRIAPALGCEIVSIKLSELQLHRPRQWGACWLACQLWDQLRLDEFWSDKLPTSRQGTRWLNVFKTLVCYRLIDPGSEWRLHKLYRCLDKLLPHKEDLFTYLKQRWQALFDAGFEVLLYDLTSTYFESDPPEEGKRKFGYSRDKRPDCVQMVIALIVTPEGFPLVYEIMVGNTSDKTTLGDFLKKIEKQCGKAHRTWVMDRGIPTEATLSQMRAAQTPIHYLVGTPKGRLSKLEKAFLKLPWDQVRESVEVKLIEQAGELCFISCREV